MLIHTTELVRNGLADGKDLATLQEETAFDKWESYAGSYVSLDQWIESLVEGLQEKKETRKTVFEPIYYVWKENGAEAAVEHYFELRHDHSDEYRFDDATLLVIGNKLLGKGHLQGAVIFLEASLQEYPDSKYNYYTNYILADAHNQMGGENTAVRYCERALELNPDFGTAAELLEKLKKK